MEDHVKGDRAGGRRSYHSPRRREQAAATRQHILEAAQRLFERQGYPATSMAAVASEADVALKTVYVVFETKSGLLHALWDRVLGGAADGVPVAARQWYLEMVAEPDPVRALQLNARNSRMVKQRAAAVMLVIRDAAAADPDTGALWELIQSEFHANQASIVEVLRRKGALRPDLDARRGADILWALNHPDLWQLLVVRQGWRPADYERWLADVTCTQLLGTPGDRAGPPPSTS